MAPTKTLRAWLKHGSREQEPPVDSALKTNNFSRRRTATSGRLRYFEKGLPLDAAMQSTGYDQRHQSENRRHPFHQHLVRMNMSPQEDRIGRCSKVGKETIFGFLPGNFRRPKLPGKQAILFWRSRCQLHYTIANIYEAGGGAGQP